MGVLCGEGQEEAGRSVSAGGGGGLRPPEIRWGVDTFVRFGRDKGVFRRRRTEVFPGMLARMWGCLKWAAEGRASWRLGVRSGSLRGVGI